MDDRIAVPCERCPLMRYLKSDSVNRGVSKLCIRCASLESWRGRRHKPMTTVRAEKLREDIARASRTHIPPPFTPTDASPGTEDKIEVMAKRHEEGVQLFHPEDFRWTFRTLDSYLDSVVEAERVGRVLYTDETCEEAA